MKKLKLTLNITLISLLLSACDQSSNSYFDSGNTKYPIIVCDNSNTSFTTIEDGDLLVKEDDLTQVTIVHDSDDNKKICVVTGSAHLLRNN